MNLFYLVKVEDKYYITPNGDYYYAEDFNIDIFNKSKKVDDLPEEYKDVLWQNTLEPFVILNTIRNSSYSFDLLENIFSPDIKIMSFFYYDNYDPIILSQYLYYIILIIDKEKNYKILNINKKEPNLVLYDLTNEDIENFKNYEKLPFEMDIDNSLKELSKKVKIAYPYAFLESCLKIIENFYKENNLDINTIDEITFINKTFNVDYAPMIDSTVLNGFNDGFKKNLLKRIRVNQKDAINNYCYHFGDPFSTIIVNKENFYIKDIYNYYKKMATHNKNFIKNKDKYNLQVIHDMIYSIAQFINNIKPSSMPDIDSRFIIDIMKRINYYYSDNERELPEKIKYFISFYFGNNLFSNNMTKRILYMLIKNIFKKENISCINKLIRLYYKTKIDDDHIGKIFITFFVNVFIKRKINKGRDINKIAKKYKITQNNITTIIVDI